MDVRLWMCPNNWMNLTAFEAAARRGECCAAAVYPRRYAEVRNNA